jgi:hypothetical protein
MGPAEQQAGLVVGRGRASVREGEVASLEGREAEHRARLGR